MTQLQRNTIKTTNAPQPLGAYSQATEVQASRLVLIAGQVSLDTAGQLVGPGDAFAQTRQVFHNIEQILKQAGTGFNNVVEFTTYVVGRDSIQPFLDARTELFPSLYPEADFPPNTLLVISGLVREEFLVEIKAVAALS